MQEYSKDFSLLDLDFRIDLNFPEETDLTIELNEQPDATDENTSSLGIQIQQNGESPKSKVPHKGQFFLTWTVPIIDFHELMTFPPSLTELGTLPQGYQNKLTWAGSSLPLFLFRHRNGNNRLSFGLLDQITETEINFELDKLEGKYTITVAKPFSLKDGVWSEALYLSTSNYPGSLCSPIMKNG